MYLNAHVELTGDCSDSSFFNYLESLQENWIEEPNDRRGGRSGVFSARINKIDVFVKKQDGHIYRSLRFPFGRPTALREKDALLAMQAIGVETPEMLYCRSRNKNRVRRTYLVTRSMEGYQSLDCFARERFNQLAPAQQQALLESVAITLATFHRHKWQHSALYPKHIFIREQASGFRTAIIDLEKMRKRLTSAQASRHDIEQFSRHQPPGWEASHWQQFLQFYQAALSQQQS